MPRPVLITQMSSSTTCIASRSPVTTIEPTPCRFASSASVPRMSSAS
jgi:hypothetical protein